MSSTNKKFKLSSENLISFFVFGPLFFIIIGIYFFLCEFLKLFFLVFQKELKINNNQKQLNGISIIIPTWNKKEMVINCLNILDKVLVKEVKIPIEILVIENGSVDGSLEALQTIKLHSLLRILPQKENLGFAKAINLAAKKASYNYLYLMNNDMEAENGTFIKLINYTEKLIKSKKDFFGIASQVFFFDKSKRREESGKTYIEPNCGFIKVAHVVNDLNLKENSLTLYPGGGSSLINKHLFLKLGGYDHNSYRPLYGEDLDLGFVAWSFGFPSYFCADSHIIHHHRSSTKQLSVDPSFIMFKNFLAFIWKNFDDNLNISRHIFFFPLMMFVGFRYRQYFLNLLPNLLNIFKQKVKLYIYKKVYSSKDLIDFINFEIKYER